MKNIITSNFNKKNIVFIVRLDDDPRSVVVGHTVLLFLIFQAKKSYEKSKITFPRNQNVVGFKHSNNAHHHIIIILLSTCLHVPIL